MVNYHEYLGSKKWFSIANRIKKRDRGCLACGTTLKLNVHHGTYQHLGQEFDEELFTLCERHHETLHTAFKRHKNKKKKGNLLWFTKEFIRKNSKKTIARRPLVVQKSTTEPVLPVPRSFDAVIKSIAIKFPKKEVPPVTQPTVFMSKNELRVAQRRLRKLEKRTRKRLRKSIASIQ